MKNFAKVTFIVFFLSSYILNLLLPEKVMLALLGIVGGIGSVWLTYHSIECVVEQKQYRDVCDFFLVAVLTVIAYLGQAWSPITATSAFVVIVPFLVVEATLFSLSLGNATVKVLSEIKTNTVTWYNNTKAELQALLQTWTPITKPIDEFFQKLWQNVLYPFAVAMQKWGVKVKEYLQKVVAKYREHRASKKAQNDVTVTSSQTPVPQNGVTKEEVVKVEASQTPPTETKKQLEA